MEVFHCPLKLPLCLCEKVVRRAHVHKGCRLTLILDSFNLVFWVDPSVKPLADASEISFVSYSSIKFSEGSAFMDIMGRLENRQF